MITPDAQVSDDEQGGHVKLIVFGGGLCDAVTSADAESAEAAVAVAGKPMIEHVLDNLQPVKEIDHIYVVTNAKVYRHCQGWADVYGPRILTRASRS